MLALLKRQRLQRTNYYLILVINAVINGFLIMDAHY